MLTALRNWVQKVTATSRKPTGQQQDSGKVGREHRAQTVANLRAEVSRLQHEISLLSDDMPAEASQATAPQRTQMTNLHTELTATQRELAKYQARI
jgi:cell division protein FtsB